MIFSAGGVRIIDLIKIGFGMVIILYSSTVRIHQITLVLDNKLLLNDIILQENSTLNCFIFQRDDLFLSFR